MKNLSIEARDNTPSVILDKEASKIEITGYSFPDDALGFYTEIIDWVKEYCKDPGQETKVTFDFKYVNSTSVKFINEILKKLDGIATLGKGVSVQWLHSSDDEDIEQLGNTLKEFHSVPFHVSVKDNIANPGKKKMF